MKIDTTDERFHVVREALSQYGDYSIEARNRIMEAAKWVMADESLAEELRRHVDNGIDFFVHHGEISWADEIVEAVEACDFDMSEGCKCAVGTVLGSWEQFDLMREAEGISAWEYGFLAGSRMSSKVFDETEVESYNEADAAVYTALEVVWHEAALHKILG
jgi:hypothetical protein